MNDLVEFWRRSQLSHPPFVHPDDRAFLQNELANKSNRANFDGYIQGERFSPDDKSLHLSLFPVPYAGDLEKAKVIVLLLNPGFNYSDYWAESKALKFRERLKRNLDQDFDGVKFPFMFLDPQFCWSSGFQWWEGKLRDVISKIAETKSKSYFEALRFLSKHLACIELFPYHSSSFRDQKLIKELPSVEKARSFVRDYLVPQAKSGKAAVIVTRGKAGWEIKKSYKGLCVYGAGQARGASLSTNTDGGKAILKRFDTTI